MASKFKRAGSGNWSADASWSTTSGGSADTTAPTSADDVFVDANSGTLTIDAASACRSINCTGFTGTLSHTAGFLLTIGDATAGASNIALKFVAGMTYTLGSATTSAILFASTSATQQSIDFAGKTTGNIEYNATSNGSWQYTGSHLQGSSASFLFTKGSLDVNGQTCNWGQFNASNSNVRSLTLGAATLQVDVWNSATITNFTFSGASSTITLVNNFGTFASGNLNYGSVIVLGSNTSMNAGTFVNITRTGNVNRTSTWTLTNNITVTGTFTVNGNSVTNRVLVASSVTGTSRTITVNTTVAGSNFDLIDITGAGSASWNISGLSGGSGDCGGNSGITFTTGATQTWQGTSGGSWETLANWSTRVPLPQDDVIISSAFSASQTITSDKPRLARSINWSSSTGSPTFSITAAASIFGSLTLISGMTISGANILTFSGRGSFSITSAGKQSAGGYTFAAPGGTYTLQDDLSTAGVFTLSNGAFDANGFNVTALTYTITGTLTRALTMGSGVWSSTSTAAATVWNAQNTTGLTFSGASATFTVTGTSSSNRTFNSTGLTYGTLNYVLSGSTGSLIMVGSNTFNIVNYLDASNARSLTLTSGITITILSTFNVNGGSGRLITLDTTSGGSAATLTKSSGIVYCEFLSVKDSTATGGASWYAGPGSTSVSGNSGWVFGKAFIFGSAKADVKTTYYSGCTYDWTPSTTPGGKNSGFNS